MRAERMAPLLLLLAASLATAEPEQYFGRPLGEVRFSSDAPIDEAGLRTLIALEPGELLTEEALDEAKRLLELTELFRRIDFELAPDGDRVILMVALSRKPVVGDVDISGLDELSEKEARRVIRIDKGMMYEPELADGAQARLLERYQRMGFVDAEVQLTVEPGDSEVTVRFDVVEGMPETIAAVIAEGDLAAWDADLQKQAKKIEGGRRTREVMRKAEQKLLRKLRAKGYYEARLRPTWERFGGNRGVLRLHLDSGPRFELEVVGNRAKDDEDLLGLIDLEQRLIVTDGTWRQLALRMREDYQKSGYYAVNVGVEVADGDPKGVTFEIEEGRRYFVRRIEFDGNEKISDEELQAAMQTTPRRRLPWPRSGRVVSTVLNEDMKRLRRLYRKRGFASAVVQKTRRKIDEERGTIDIVVPIREGAQTVVREVVDAEVPPAVDRGALRLRAGVGFDPDGIEADRRTIESALRRDGYPEPRVEAVIEKHEQPDAIEASVIWKVSPGQRELIGRLVVQHNVDTRSEAILRELPFHEGDPLAVDRLLEGQVDIYRLGLFRSVSISPITPPGKPVRDVAVSVTERPAGTLTLGGGYNTRDGLKGLAEVGYDNIGGMARRLSLRIEASLDPTSFTPDQYLANLGFVEPRLFDSAWRYKVSVIAERSTQTVDKYSIQRVAFGQSFDRKLWKRVQSGLELQAEQSRIFDVQDEAAVIPEDQGDLRTVTLTPFLAYDGRNDPFLPTRGFYDSFAFRYALPTLSNVQFGKLTTQHAQWVPLGRKVAFFYSARLGYGRVISGAPILPLRERFFLGGRTTVRGFSENSIGPIRQADGNDHELGGDLSVNFNAELIFPLVYSFQLAVFLDGGGLYLVQCDASCRSENDIENATVNLDNFRRSAGLGLRYNTPVGPLALDYGIKLDRRDGESFGRLHFNIGTTF